MDRDRWLHVLLPGLMLAWACCGTTVEDRYEEMMAREDARDADAVFWEQQLTRSQDAGSRARAARAIGRLRDPALAPLLQRAFAVEGDAAVRAELVFAMGQVIDGDLVDEILGTLANGDATLRARGIEALAKHDIESASSALIGLLADPDAEVRGQALLALVRLRGRRNPPDQPLAPETLGQIRGRMAGLLEDEDAGVRWRAAYALSEIDLEGRQPLLLKALAAEEAVVRFFACAGLARLAGKEELPIAPLQARLEDPDAQVAATACVALRRAGARAALESLRRAAQRHTSPADWHVRHAALQALAELAEPDDAATRDVVHAALRDESRTVRGRALVVLARLDPAAAPLVEAATKDRDVFTRIASAEAATFLARETAQALLRDLQGDADRRVVVAALEHMEAAGIAGPWLREVALGAVSSKDLAIRGTGLTLLQKCGTAEDLAVVQTASERSAGFEAAEVRVTAVQTAAKLGASAAGSYLTAAAADVSPAVREAAAKALRELNLPVPTGEPVEVRSTPELKAGRDSHSTAPNPRAVMHTDKGALELELLREEAPHHVRSFLDLARDGTYDGLDFHRVVTGFVVQGLDPRGDGWGTGGVFLRDEINPVPYLAGTVGMPNAGPDTGGCQLFITHVPTPHLDGRYTVFARVVAGMDVVNAIEVGDRCRSVEIR